MVKLPSSGDKPGEGFLPGNGQYYRPIDFLGGTRCRQAKTDQRGNPRETLIG
jgi:hypothetical protein